MATTPSNVTSSLYTSYERDRRQYASLANNKQGKSGVSKPWFIFTHPLTETKSAIQRSALVGSKFLTDPDLSKTSRFVAPYWPSLVSCSTLQPMWFIAQFSVMRDDLLPGGLFRFRRDLASVNNNKTCRLVAKTSTTCYNTCTPDERSFSQHNDGKDQCREGK